MRKLSFITLFTTLLITVFSVSAAETDSNAKENLFKILKGHFPEITQEEINVTKIDGLYEVARGPSIIYMSEDGRYIFSGDIIDTQDQFKNLTESSRRKARVAELGKLNSTQTIDFIPKNPKHIVTVFTDIDCGYCRKFHENIKELNAKGIGVKYLAFPRGGEGTEGFIKAVSVWCAKNPKEAITLAKKGKDVKQVACQNNPVDREYQLGLMMGVTGTPSIVLENGVIIPGYLPPDKLEEVLNKMDEI